MGAIQTSLKPIRQAVKKGQLKLSGKTCCTGRISPYSEKPQLCSQVFQLIELGSHKLSRLISLLKDQRLLILCYTMLSCSVVSNSLQHHGLQRTRLLCPKGFSRQEYQTGLPCSPPGHLPNPGIEPKSPALQVDSYHLSHHGSPSILERVADPFSRGTSSPRNRTGVSCIAGKFFIS